MLRLILGGGSAGSTAESHLQHRMAAWRGCRTKDIGWCSCAPHTLVALPKREKRKKSTWLCKIMTISAKRKTHAHSWNCNPQREKRKLSASRSQIEGKRGNNTLHSLQATVPRTITSHTQPLGQVWLSVTQHSCTRDTGGAHRSTISARMLCEIDDHKAV